MKKRISGIEKQKNFRKDLDKINDIPYIMTFQGKEAGKVLLKAKSSLSRSIHLQKIVSSTVWTILVGPCSLKTKFKITNSKPGAKSLGCFSICN